IRSRHPPTIINNIGLIVMPEDENNIENFKVAFQEKCRGKLFIYRIRYENMESDLLFAFDFFKKYHYIDLICLLTNQLTTNNICSLSSKNIVKYMLNRKNVPYVISIISLNKVNSTMQPLTVMLSNEEIENINNCINYIHNIQFSLRKKIDEGIKTGIDIL